MSNKLYEENDVQNIANAIRNVNNALDYDGYERLDYLESTGTQYIDTGITCTTDTGLKIKYRYTDSGSAAISGIFQSSSPRTDTLFISSSNGTTSSTIFAAHRGALLKPTPDIDISLNTDYEWTINYLNDGKAYLNNESCGNVGSNTPYSSNILLFARLNASNSNISISNSRIYYAEFTEGNNVSHKFVPMKRTSDNEYGLYDLVTNTFFTNAGTGDFVGGAGYPKYKISEMAQAINDFPINNIESALHTLNSGNGANSGGITL